MVDINMVARSRERFKLCRAQLAKAKHDIKFWSEELRLISEVLIHTDQGCFSFFDEVLNDGGCEDEVPQEVIK